MFNNCNGLLISDGNFHNVSGDVNLGMHRQLLVQDFADLQHAGTRDEQSSLRSTPGLGRLPREIDDTAPIYITTPNVNARGTALDTLHRHAALEALYDSAESFPQPRCHPETRIGLLETLRDRLINPEIRVVWLHGPAGAGKSAIMQTLSQHLEEAGNLGGTFFFKRGHSTRGNARVLFATLAYQLALFFPAAKALILESIRRKPLLVGTSIASQLRELLVEPCRRVTDSTSMPPRILLVDGLDECDGSPVQREILRSIQHIFCKHALPVKIIVASRPEPEIQEIFNDPSFHGLDSVNIEQSFKDVENFLRKEFSRIHGEHHETMADVPLPWPSSDIIQTLVDHSSGYFIFAATVIKFIDDKQFRPTDQLQIVLNPTADSEDYPFGSLDKLYIQILEQVPRRFRPQLLGILSVIAARWDLSPRHIEQLFGYRAGDVRLILRNLRSLLEIGDEDYPVRATHASFLDFMQNKTRSGLFCVGGAGASSRRSDLYRRLAGWIDLITSIEPHFVGAAELLPCIQGVNLDFVFHHLPNWFIYSRADKLISWLKIVSGAPKDLIVLWERIECMYHFSLFEFIRCSHSEAVQEALQNLLLRKPQLERIMGVAHLIGESSLSERGGLLYKTRMLLNLSWDDLIASVWHIRPIVDIDSKCSANQPAYTNQVKPNPKAAKDIALGFIRLLRKINDGELQTTILDHMEMDHKWGRLIATQLSDAEVFNELSEVVLPTAQISANPGPALLPEDFSVILAGLKAYDGCPSELIDRWTGYFKESERRKSNPPRP
ncbi:hypothetical protein FB45DRAFT_1067469 [Roridomyces roridus]|uniref:NACHT domain-containing protein n=1 Tax=Roridomyces roridus TaxID=1738132 RepID=A0AAD7B233_9AGAR|nr:hypothetical protein FB45DRAFT_1067469 [Roridomyces roridus]